MALLILLPLLIFALLFPSAARSQAPLQRVVITYSSRSIASIDLFVAQERGFFREEGLDPQLVQVRATAAIAAIVSGEVHALGSIGSAVRAIQRGAPIKVLAVSLRRPLFWLVSRPELKSFRELKGKVIGTTTIGGSQHTAGIRLLRKAGLDPDKDVTVVLAGDVPTQLQALVNGSIQIGILSPPSLIVARDKYKMNVLAGAMDEFASLQNDLGVLEKNLREQKELVKRILRARAKGSRYFQQNERGSSEVLPKFSASTFRPLWKLIASRAPPLRRMGFRPMRRSASTSRWTLRSSVFRHQFRPQRSSIFLYSGRSTKSWG